MPPHDHSAPLPDLHLDVGHRLAERDQRYTASRRQLIDTLSRAGRPVTLTDITELAPGLALSSIYRNLDVLRDCGVVSRLTVGQDAAYFELTEAILGHHHHLICIECGDIRDMLLDDELESLVDEHLANAAGAAGFSPLRHTLDLHGHCAKCRSN